MIIAGVIIVALLIALYFYVIINRLQKSELIKVNELAKRNCAKCGKILGHKAIKNAETIAKLELGKAIKRGDRIDFFGPFAVCIFCNTRNDL